MSPAPWSVLTERESARAAHSLALGRASSAGMSPAEVFYSVRNSVKHRASNRYSNIHAYDRTAVVVNGEYLNANIVRDGYGAWWVASQAPIPSTIPLFLQAIRDGAASRHPLVKSDARGAIIVQLTGYEERGIKKADRYLGHLDISSTTHDAELASTVVEGHLDQVPVTHYHFEAWPDHGVPAASDRGALRALVHRVAERQRDEGREVWVHCSAGVGRSGAFIALSSLLVRKGERTTEDSPLGPLPLVDPVAETVDGIREYRGMLVQTEEQYDLIQEMAI